MAPSDPYTLCQLPNVVISVFVNCAEDAPVEVVAQRVDGALPITASTIGINVICSAAKREPKNDKNEKLCLLIIKVIDAMLKAGTRPHCRRISESTFLLT